MKFHDFIHHRSDTQRAEKSHDANGPTAVIFSGPRRVMTPGYISGAVKSDYADLVPLYPPLYVRCQFDE